MDEQGKAAGHSREKATDRPPASEEAAAERGCAARAGTRATRRSRRAAAAKLAAAEPGRPKAQDAAKGATRRPKLRMTAASVFCWRPACCGEHLVFFFDVRAARARRFLAAE